MIGIISGLVTGLVVGAFSPAAHTPANVTSARAAAPAVAQAGDAGEPLDARWRPWLGCWQLWEEQLDPSATDDDSESAALLDRTVICVRPAAGGRGVNLTAAAGEEVLVDRTLVADGVERDVREPDCTGRERNTWSADGRRLFTRAEVRCGDQPVRRASGVSLLSSPATWVDIQVVEVGGRELLEVRRYAPVPDREQAARLGPQSGLGAAPGAIQRARRAGAAQPDLSDVLDASGKTSPRVVEALLGETEPRLALDRDALVALDDAGINGGVIDLLVALGVPRPVRRRAARPGRRVVVGRLGRIRRVPRSDLVQRPLLPVLRHAARLLLLEPRLRPLPVRGPGLAVRGGVGRRSQRGAGAARAGPGLHAGLAPRLDRRGRGRRPWIGRTSSGGSSSGGSSGGGSSGGAVSRGGYSGGSSGTPTRSGGTSTGRRAVPRR